MADESGKPTSGLLKMYEALAKGGVGGIIAGEIVISSDAKPLHGLIPSLDCDENIASFLSITEKCTLMEFLSSLNSFIQEDRARE